MSTINTNGMNVNYPVPGVNNDSQGFRTNFASIKNNLDTASTEITDLQNKVILKSALANTTLNNDMANTLISNALTRGFRASTYNLGNALSGTVVINASLGDIQYGTVAGNTTLQFTGWAPTGTQGNIELQLAISNANAVISFPESISSNQCYGVTTLENYANVANVTTVSIPYGVCQLDYRLSSTDCGNTITIEPYNRPRKSTELRIRTPAPTGFQGDVLGTICTDANYVYICTGSYDAAEVGPVSVTNTTAADPALTTINEITLSYIPPTLELNAPITFTGNLIATAGITANTVYYVKSIVGANSAITISDTGFWGTAGATFPVTTANANISNAFTGFATSYNGTAIWKRMLTSGISGDLTIEGLLAVSVSDGISAAGTTQADATLLTTNINMVDAFTAGAGVMLPVAVAGYRIVIRNNDPTNTLNVYPNIGATIGSAAADIAVTQLAVSAIEYFCSSSATAGVGGKWYLMNSAYS